MTGSAVFLLNRSIPITVAMTFGALISATDPVAVIAQFRSANVSRRLSVIIELESLLNDGTAIVIYGIVLTSTAVGTIDPVGGLIDFVRVAAGGVIVGVALGWTVVHLLAQIDNYLVETTLTTCLAFGAYLIADYFHVSGVLAVVAAGLVFGNLSAGIMSPTTQIVVNNFWEYLTFISNSFVFLLIGLAIDVSQLANSLVVILVAISAVLLSRAIIIYLPPLFLPRLRRSLPMAWRHILWWGGSRGVVSLALALSLPISLEGRDTIRVMTFGVVLFTLVIQATTMPNLLRRLKLVQGTSGDLARHLNVGRTYAANAAWQRLLELHKNGLLVGDTWKGLQAQHDTSRHQLEQEMEALYREQGDFERDIRNAAQREALHAERAALVRARQRRLINEEAFRQLIADVDRRIERVQALDRNPTQTYDQGNN